MSDKPKLKLADNVTVLDLITSHDLPVERVLDAAQAANLTNVTVVGYDANGDFYFASTIADGPNVLWDLEKAKHALMEISA